MAGESLTAAQEEAKTRLAEGLDALRRADHRAAAGKLRQCVELDPTDVQSWCYLGMALINREPGAAAEALERALAINPNDVGSLYWRAEVYWIVGDPLAAARLLHRMNEVAPGGPGNLARLGLAYLDGGNREAAMAAFVAAVEAGGGLEAVATAHAELRKAIYLDVLGRRDRARCLIETVNGGGLLASYPADRYPRPMEEQQADLERVGAGRDIVILGSGPSLAELGPLLQKLGSGRARHLCFFGFNNVPVQERYLQESIGRGVDLACMTASAVMELHRAWLAEFLARPPATSLFLTLADALMPGAASSELVRSRPDRVFYFASSGEHPPIPEDPLHVPPVNTLMCVLPFAVLARPRAIFLFGCDGAAPAALRGNADVYFRQGAKEYGKQELQNRSYANWLARDTFFFNAFIATVLKSLSVLHRVPIPPIYLCTPQSAYRPFPRIGTKRTLWLLQPGSSWRARVARAFVGRGADLG